MLEALNLMRWPILACLILPGLVVYLGLHIVRREIIFVDLALAQVAALGTCLALLRGYDIHDWQTYAWSVGFTFVGAALFALTRTKSSRVPQEALIGVVYVVAAAAAILLLSRSPEGTEAFRRTLIGEVLLVGPWEIMKTAILFVVIGAVHVVFRRQFLLLSFDAQAAQEIGMNIRAWDFLFYVLFGFVVTSFVQIGGVLLVFSYLIIPAICANYLANALSVRLAIAWVTATIGSMLGLFVSYRFDFPVGAAIVCALGLLMLLVLLLGRKFHGPSMDSSFTAEGKDDFHGVPL